MTTRRSPTSIYLGRAGDVPAESDTALLDDDEIARAAKFVRDRDAAHYVGAHADLRRAVAAELGCDPATVRTARRPCPRCGSSEHGPPAIVWPEDAGYVSLSRSGGAHAIALSETPVGVDLEQRDRADPTLAARVFTPGELELWERVPDPARPGVFLRWWVRKEAVVKAMGIGLVVDLASIDVSGGRVPDDLDAAAVVPVVAGGSRWSVADVPSPLPEVIVAVALQGDALGAEPAITVHDMSGRAQMRLARPARDESNPVKPGGKTRSTPE